MEARDERVTTPIARPKAVRHQSGDVQRMPFNGVPARSLARHRPTLLEVLILFALVLGIYLLNGRAIASGDTEPNRYLPVSILRDGSFYLDGFPFLYTPKVPYYVRHFRDHYVSCYPVSGAVLAVPIYLPAVLRGEGPVIIPSVRSLTPAVLSAGIRTRTWYSDWRLASRITR